MFLRRELFRIADHGAPFLSLMTDHFARLNIPRRPWPDPAAIDERFRTASAATHPDSLGDVSPEERRAANEAFAALNAAHQCLKDPKRRLAHLLELIRGRPLADVTAIPNDQASLFMDFNGLLSGVDAFLASKEAAQTALQRAALMGEGLDWTDRLQAFLSRIRSLFNEAAESVQSVEASWPGADAAPSPDQLAALESACRAFSFLGRWEAQINDRMTKLAI